jgi:MFS family permease
VSFYLTRRIANKRRFMVVIGQIEITAASAIALAALLPQEHRFMSDAALLVAAYLIGHTVSPQFNSWVSNVIPEDVRAPYIGRRMFILTVTSMVYLYLASVAVDHLPQPNGFYLVFAAGWVAGLLGYWVLVVTPFPKLELQEGSSFAKSLVEPLMNREFALLALFMCTWTMALRLASALYGVYMIKYLGLTYSRIAIYTNIALLCMVIGYLASGSLAQRYGSKPLAQILIIPGMAAPLLWALMTKGNCGIILPIVCVLAGISISGILVAVSSLLYKIVPSGVDNSAYFANWTGLSAVAAGIGPFVAGSLRGWLGEEVHVFGLEMSSLQAIFGIGGILYIVPLIFSAFIVEPEAASPRYVLAQFRGNLLSFGYNFALYAVARDDESRAEAIRRVGRSRTPLAVSPLMRALGHVSHEVRSEAARGLGEGHFREAVTPLVEALEDENSDIRPEAAEALGKIGDQAVAGRLRRAVHDSDMRVRMSAASALGEVGGEEAAAALMEALRGPFDRAMFPTLVEAATRRSDLRLVEPIMNGLPNLQLPVVRMQVINGVCRLLGEKNHFYKLATAARLERAGMGEAMMERIVRLLGRAERADGRMSAALKGPARAAAEIALTGLARSMAGRHERDQAARA